MQVHQRSLESFEDNNSNPFFVGRDKMLHFFAKYFNEVTLNFTKYIYRNSYSNSSKIFCGL